MIKRFLSVALVMMTIALAGCNATMSGVHAGPHHVTGYSFGGAPAMGYGQPVYGAPMIIHQPAPNCPRADGRAIFARSAGECHAFRQQLAQQHYYGQQRRPVPAGSCPPNRFPGGCRQVNGQWMGVPAY